MTWQTHDVFNQFDELSDYNVFGTDAALAEAVRAADAEWALPALDSYGATIGSAESFRQADEANRHPPELQVFDRRGRRIDQVDFHPSWHALMAKYRGAGWVSLSARDTQAGPLGGERGGAVPAQPGRVRHDLPVDHDLGLASRCSSARPRCGRR